MNSVWEALEQHNSAVEPDYNFIQELFSQKVVEKKAKSETKKKAPTEVAKFFDRLLSALDLNNCKGVAG